MIRLVPSALVALAALALQGCCCCSVPSGLIPDDVADELTRTAAEEGLRIATGVDVDSRNGQFSIETEEGSFRVAEGDAGRDPRIPVAPYPDCKVVGGATMSDKASNRTTLSYAQQDCPGTFEAYRDWFEDQLTQLGMEIDRVKATQNGQRSTMLTGTATDDGPVRQVTVAVGEHEDGTISVILGCERRTGTGEAP